MGHMGAMAMPGGWSMSMMWMRMPGQSWPGAAAAFLGMWTMMMLAMMLPSFLPMAWRFRQAVCPSCPARRRLGLIAVMGAGYLTVWALLGLVTFLAGVALATCAMRQPALARVVPIAVGMVVLSTGALQFTAWKARHLACCRAAPEDRRTLPADPGTAWRHGLRLGLHCCACCAGSTMVLLALGLMDLRVMAAVTAAITLERLAPAGQRIARALGVVVVACGVIVIARTACA